VGEEMKMDIDAKSPSFWRFFFSNSRYWIAPVIGSAILIIGLIQGILTNSYTMNNNILFYLGSQITGWGLTFGIWFCIIDYRRARLNIELQKKP